MNSIQLARQSLRAVAVAALSIAAALPFARPASATDIVLFDWALHVDGTMYVPGDPLPPILDASGFDFATGLGTLALALPGAGTHGVFLFVDHEIDENVNTFFNEYGTAVGAKPSTLQWEIDEPGYSFGDIYGHVVAASLDNSNAVPAAAPDDVSMALGHLFTLGASNDASIVFTVGTARPAGGFFLVQTDPDSQASIYFSTSLFTGQAPEPGSIVLLGVAAAAFAAIRRRIR